MLVEMLPASGGGGDAYTTIPYGYKAYGNRWNYKSGGFRVKNGVCYVNAVLTAAVALSDGQTLFDTGTMNIPSSAQGSTWVDMGDVKVRYNASARDAFYANKAIASGSDFVFNGQYLTGAPDSEAQV